MEIGRRSYCVRFLLLRFLLINIIQTAQFFFLFKFINREVNLYDDKLLVEEMNADFSIKKNSINIFVAFKQFVLKPTSFAHANSVNK